MYFNLFIRCIYVYAVFDQFKNKNKISLECESKERHTSIICDIYVRTYIYIQNIG